MKLTRVVRHRLWLVSLVTASALGCGNDVLAERDAIVVIPGTMVAPDAAPPPEMDSDALIDGTDSPAFDWYPCNGNTDGYDAVVKKIEDRWRVTSGETSVWIGADMITAVQEAYATLDQDRDYKQSVLVMGDGTIPADTRSLRIPSYTVFNMCGTINVVGKAPAGDWAAIYVRPGSHIDIPNIRITGTPKYGMFFRSVSHLHIGKAVLDLEPESGLGIRIDNNPPSEPDGRVNEIVIDRVSVSYSGGHGVETYGVDGLTIGEFIGDHTANAGLLLNNSVNVQIGSVVCNECAYLSTYAAFRVANSNGKIGDDWPAGNVHVGSVYARGGGRGIFSVSASGGLTIDTIDLGDHDNTPILLQNAYNTTIAASSGTVSSGDTAESLRIVLSNASTNTGAGNNYATSYNVTLQNLTLRDGVYIEEDYCDFEGQGDRNNRVTNITGGTVDMCYE